MVKKLAWVRVRAREGLMGLFVGSKCRKKGG